MREGAVQSWNTRQTAIVFSEEIIGQINEWREKQKIKPSFSMAVRYLVKAGLAKEAEGDRG